MVPWFVILISELRFRKMYPEKIVDHPFKMPFYPWTNYIAIASLLVILVFMFLNPDTLISVIIGIIFLVVMTGVYYLQYGRQKRA